MKHIAANGLNHAVRDVGEGPAVVLLHGFPDTSSMWEPQIELLSQAGWRAIAPDLRGRGQTEMPAQLADYTIPNIVGDVTAIMDELGVERAHVVGHDWGAVIAWALAAYDPQRVEKLVVLSVGHPGASGGPSLEALQKGWYRLLFQFDSAEDILRHNDWAMLRVMLEGQTEFEQHRNVLAAPGALTAGINWYRANMPPERLMADGPTMPEVQAATFGLFGGRDPYLTEQAMAQSATKVAGEWRYELFADAGHWLHIDEPERFNQLLLEFLGAPG